MAQNEPMDYGLCQGMRHLPTEQNPDPQEENPALRNNDNARYETLLPNCNGPDHRPASSKWERHHTNHSRPRMLQGGNLHPLHDNHHGTRNSTTIPMKCLPLVRPSVTNHFRPRPQIHLSIWKSPYSKTRNQPQHLHGVSPSNRWPLRKEEPMDRAISSNSHISKPGGLDAVASPSISSPQ